MPNAAPRPCRHPGCGQLVRDGSGYCQLHKAASKKESGFGKQRLSTSERGYGASWRRLREVVLHRDAGLCQPCKMSGRLTPGSIVDHIKPKAEGGSDDLENLQVICRPCHVLKTAGESARGGGRVLFEPDWLPPSLVPVTVVCGPPGSGKSTYVREHASSGDLVLDADEIAANMFSLPIYHATFDQICTAIRYRNKMLAGLASKDCGYQRAWLIVTAGDWRKREFWRSKYGDIVTMSTPKLECVARIKEDQRRPEQAKKRAIEAVYQWA